MTGPAGWHRHVSCGVYACSLARKPGNALPPGLSARRRFLEAPAVNYPLPAGWQEKVTDLCLESHRRRMISHLALPRPMSTDRCQRGRRLQPSLADLRTRCFLTMKPLLRTSSSGHGNRHRQGLKVSVPKSSDPSPVPSKGLRESD